MEAKNIVDHKSYWKRYIKGKIHQQEEKVWWQNMISDDVNKKKVRMLHLTSLKLEAELTAKSDYRGRSYHTSLRSGTNVLEIETARWKKIHRDFRFCTNCEMKAVETERHFLFECSITGI